MFVETGPACSHRNAKTRVHSGSGLSMASVPGKIQPAVVVASLLSWSTTTTTTWRDGGRSLNKRLSWVE